MIPHAHSRALVLAMGMAFALAPAESAAPDRIGSYDFSYQSSGDQRVRPIQVFDDGKTTWFQFRSGDPIPAIFAETASGPVFMVPQMEGPYVKVATLVRSYSLRLGVGSGRVLYFGGSRPPNEEPQSESAAPVPVDRPQGRLLAASQMVSGLPREMFNPPPSRIALEINSYATPIKGDAVQWLQGSDKQEEHSIVFATDSAKLSVTSTRLIQALAARARPNTRFELVGRDDDRHKEKVAESRAAAVLAAIQAAGVPRSNISAKATAETKDAGKGQWVGVTVRVVEPSGALVQQSTREVEVANIVKRLQEGRISAAGAIAALDQLRTTAASPQQAQAVGAMPTTWLVKKSDENIEKMLERWAREAGWKLVWQAGPLVPITGDSGLSRPDFLQAADYVISQAKSAGYRIKATAYSNNTLLVTGD